MSNMSSTNYVSNIRHQHSYCHQLGDLIKFILVTWAFSERKGQLLQETLLVEVIFSVDTLVGMIYIFESSLCSNFFLKMDYEKASVLIMIPEFLTKIQNSTTIEVSYYSCQKKYKLTIYGRFQGPGSALKRFSPLKQSFFNLMSLK